ncbi:MAG: DNA polymerase Y family protein [Hyphomicrobiales bacterium]
MTLADARARVPGFAAVVADPAADARLLARLADDCERFTPLVALDRPAGLVLDITGCDHLFGGEKGLRAALLARLERAGLAARAAIAGTPDAAGALARFGRTGIVPPGGEPAAVRSLPVAALAMPDEVTLALARAGLKTVGDLAARPSRPLAARFGEALPRRLRRVLGAEDVRITPRRLPPPCLLEERFAEPVARTEDIEAILAGLAARAAGLLEGRGEGGRAFEVAFFRTDGAVRRIAVETGRPTRTVATVLRLFRERLDALADPLDPGFGFDLVRFAVPVVEPLAERQPALAPAGMRAADGAGVVDLVDRLAARFGRDRVLRFHPRDSHDPDRAAMLVSALDDPGAACLWSLPGPDEPPARPLQIFEPPCPVEALAEVPDGPPLRFRWRRVLHEVVRAEGPERIAPEWWRKPETAPTRDYYRVEDAAGRRFWLFRAGLYGEGATPPRWYLHGLFP